MLLFSYQQTCNREFWHSPVPRDYHSKRVNPHIRLILKLIPLKLFVDMVPSFSWDVTRALRVSQAVSQSGSQSVRPSVGPSVSYPDILCLYLLKLLSVYYYE